MSKMQFNVKCVKNCLVSNGRVFTVRSWNGYAQESMVEVEGVGICKKIRIGKVSSKADIARYVKFSGFNNVDDWWTKVISFGAQDGWLFLVAKVKQEEKKDPNELTWKCSCGKVNHYCELYQPEEMTDEGIASAYWYVRCSCGCKELI